mmetsp:Transcript_61187/g.97362  ORF Transcript_61187/g.97362 Transcript_61187/m.97362 type:complete len:321 (-) Transcript_61187:456-1418(-)
MLLIARALALCGTRIHFVLHDKLFIFERQTIDALQYAMAVLLCFAQSTHDLLAHHFLRLPVSTLDRTRRLLVTSRCVARRHHHIHVDCVAVHKVTANRWPFGGVLHTLLHCLWRTALLGVSSNDGSRLKRDGMRSQTTQVVGFRHFAGWIGGSVGGEIAVAVGGKHLIEVGARFTMQLIGIHTHYRCRGSLVSCSLVVLFLVRFMQIWFAVLEAFEGDWLAVIGTCDIAHFWLLVLVGSLIDIERIRRVFLLLVLLWSVRIGLRQWSHDLVLDAFNELLLFGGVVDVEWVWRAFLLIVGVVILWRVFDGWLIAGWFGRRR